MFDANELASLDSNYFTVIYKDIYETPATTGACTVRAIRSREQLSSFIRILLPALTISMEGRPVCDRR